MPEINDSIETSEFSMYLYPLIKSSIGTHKTPEYLFSIVLNIIPILFMNCFISVMCFFGSNNGKLFSKTSSLSRNSIKLPIKFDITSSKLISFRE